MTSDMLDDIRFWAHIITDSERVIVCPPEFELKIKAIVEVMNVAGLITVIADPACPKDRLLMIDTHAIEAAMRRRMQSGT